MTHESQIHLISNAQGRQAVTYANHGGSGRMFGDASGVPYALGLPICRKSQQERVTQPHSAIACRAYVSNRCPREALSILMTVRWTVQPACQLARQLRRTHIPPSIVHFLHFARSRAASRFEVRDRRLSASFCRPESNFPRL